MMENKLLTILGHTAGGKTSLAAHTAKMLDAEIISADSRQVYRGMDLGTGKDLADYHVAGVDVPFHLIDIVDAGYEYSVFEFQRDFTAAFNDITARGRLPLMCGGSGLYIESVLRKYRMINVPVNGQVSDLEGSAVINKAVESAQQELGETGRVILRPSGTEPLIRVTLEGQDEDQVNRLAEQLADVVRTELAG